MYCTTSSYLKAVIYACKSPRNPDLQPVTSVYMTSSWVKGPAGTL